MRVRYNMDYEQLIKDVGEGDFSSRLNNMIDLVNKFLSDAKYPNTVVCNERIMYHVLLDYYADIRRLKEFHDIKHTKTDKVVAYLVYWILRRKPIQLQEYSEKEKDIFVNERFACSFLITECLLEDDKNVISKEAALKLDKYIDLVLYYFKYRHCDPQVIELMIESFKMGKAIK